MSWFSTARKGPAQAGLRAGSPAPDTARARGHQGAAAVAVAPPAEHSSLGFQALLKALPERPAILDLGPAIGGNVEFFSARHARLRIADLHNSLLAAGPRPQDDPARTAEVMTGVLPFGDDERFDAVLTWDLFNYLRLDEIGIAMRRILPFAAPGATLFSLISFQKEIPAQPQVFRIKDAKTLLYGGVGGVGDVGGISRPCPRYKLPDLERQMPGFVVDHSFLLRNGMQEYVLAWRPATPAPPR